MNCREVLGVDTDAISVEACGAMFVNQGEVTEDSLIIGTIIPIVSSFLHRKLSGDKADHCDRLFFDVTDNSNVLPAAQHVPMASMRGKGTEDLHCGRCVVSCNIVVIYACNASIESRDPPLYRTMSTGFP
jgi:hypothetical protein